MLLYAFNWCCILETISATMLQTQLWNALMKVLLKYIPPSIVLPIQQVGVYCDNAFCAFRRSSATLDKPICSASQEKAQKKPSDLWGSCTANTCMQKLSKQQCHFLRCLQYISFEQLILLPWHLRMQVSSTIILSLVTGPC